MALPHTVNPALYTCLRSSCYSCVPICLFMPVWSGYGLMWCTTKWERICTHTADADSSLGALSYTRWAQYVSQCKLQNALRNLPRVRIRVRSGLWLGSASGLDQKFANCACAISKWRSAFCKLRRFTNRAIANRRSIHSADAYLINWQTSYRYKWTEYVWSIIELIHGMV